MPRLWPLALVLGAACAGATSTRLFVHPPVTIATSAAPIPPAEKRVFHSILDAIMPKGRRLAGLSVDARSLNPDSEGVAKSQCVSFSLGGGAKYQCGDVQVAHVLPTVRFRNTPRTPILVYNSATAQPRPIIAALVATPASTTTDSITATLALIGGSTLATQKFVGTPWGSGGVSRRIALSFDGSGYATGAYRYAFTIVAKIAGQNYTTADTGYVVIVNRSASKYGAGWWPASAVKFLHMADGTGLLVNGDGSWRRYYGSFSTGMSSTYLTGRDTVFLDNTGFCQSTGPWTPPHHCWKQMIRGGGYNLFDEGGNLTRSVAVSGASTNYYVNSAEAITKITLTGVLNDTIASYGFSYDGSGYLSQITAPGLSNDSTNRRSVFTTVSSGRLTQIRDVDSLVTGFAYAGSTNLLASRTDKRSYALSFTYDSALKLLTSSRPLNASETAVTTFCAAEVQGIAGVNCSAGPSDTAQVATLVDGPRDSVDVVDRVKIWVTNTGAPRKVVDALGDTTVLTYGDSRYEGLPTKVQSPDGHTIQMWYSAYANPDSTKDLSRCISSVCATSRYEFDTVFNHPTKVTNPRGDFTNFIYAFDGSGHLSAQTPMGSDSLKTSYAYDSTGLISTITYPMDNSGQRTTDSLFYDDNGNIRRVQSAVATSQHLSFSRYDFGGNLLVKGEDISYGHLTAQISTFDKMGRPVTQKTQCYYAVDDYHVCTSLADSAIATMSYDAVGNLLALTRHATGVPDSLTTRWTYDQAGRRLTEIDGAGLVDSTVYDKAGNTVAQINRRGQTVSATYDALNRVVARIVPSVTYDSSRSGIAALQPTGGDTANPAYPRYPNASGHKYVIPADTSHFTYDVASRILTANNRAARVTRTYTSSGQLATEEQRVMTWAGTGADSNYAAHDYLLQYTYDLNGRMVSLQHPAQLLPRDSARTVYSTTTFAYDSGTGRLKEVRDPFRQAHRYTYAPRGDLLTAQHTALGSGFVSDYRDSVVYDASGYTWPGTPSSGYPEERGVSVPVGVSPYHKSVFFGYLQYDAGGRVIQMQDDSDVLSDFYYTPLGAVYDSYMGGNIAGIDWSSCELFTNDGLGNLLKSSNDPGCTGTGVDTVSYFYEAGTNRLQRTKIPGQRVQRNSYDAAGNLEFTYSDSVTASSSVYYDAQDRYSYYAADGRVMAADARSAAERRSLTSHPYDSLSTVFEEYRYDALGRRVAVRARKACSVGMGTFCKVGTVRRTVWSGNQELHEITMPGNDDASASEMENDTLPIVRAFPKEHEPGSSYAFDAWTLFGRELYVFGLQGDQPEGIIRSNYVATYPADTSRAPHKFRDRTIVPVFDNRGVFVGGAFGELTNGDGSYSETDTLSHAYTMYIPTPMPQMAYAPNSLIPDAATFGTLLGGKMDAVGTMYRRNRYYDPATGRFTQEDPIGFGGGLNLYGYAGGDPINFSDPSGLSPTCDCGYCGDYGQVHAAECGLPNPCADFVCYDPLSDPGDPPIGGGLNKEGGSINACTNELGQLGIALFEDISWLVGGKEVILAGKGAKALLTGLLEHWLAESFKFASVTISGKNVRAIARAQAKDLIEDGSFSGLGFLFGESPPNLHLTMDSFLGFAKDFIVNNTPGLNTYFKAVAAGNCLAGK